jgi:hypothetical protein
MAAKFLVRDGIRTLGDSPGLGRCSEPMFRACDEICGPTLQH